MATKFSKERLVKSNRFKDKRDALNAILKDDKEYSIQEVEEALNSFYKGSHSQKQVIPAYDEITAKEIKARLEALKIDYSGVTTKKELYELLKKRRK